MAFKRGDFSARLPEDWTGVPGKIADTFNTVIENNERLSGDWNASCVWSEKKAESHSGIAEQRARLLGRCHRMHQFFDRGSSPSDERNGARDRRCREGRFVPNDGY